MAAENPYATPTSAETASGPQPENAVSSAHAAYNIVSDTVGGLNFRARDNWFQLKCIGVSMLVLSVVGAGLGIVYLDPQGPWYVNALFGAVGGVLAGLVVGAFGSGIYLMIYRALCHVRGKHD